MVRYMRRQVCTLVMALVLILVLGLVQRLVLVKSICFTLQIVGR